MKGDCIPMKLRRLLSCILALLLASSLPLTAFAAEYDLAQGSVKVEADDSGQYVTQTEAGINRQEDANPVITQSTETTSNTITIKAEENATANVTLDGVNIDVSGTGDYQHKVPGEAAVQITGNGDVTLELDGENTVQSGFSRAGVEKNDGDSSGKLTITDENGTDGSLEATGGVYGSGIGGGNDGSGSDITITGSAEVTANGGMDAAGIGGGAGGGDGGSGSNITISGSAEVTAKGDITGAGIGGGYNDNGNVTGSNITVSEDAQVKAQGGNGYYNGHVTFGTGAAIGDGGGEISDYNPEAVKGKDAVVTTDAPQEVGSYGLYVGELNKGWVATYTPGTHDLDNATPNSLTYKDDNGNLTTSSNAQPIVKLEPTCTEDGHRAGFMIGSTQVGGEKLQATGHSFTNYISNNDATYDSDGTKTAKCDHCDATDTIPDPGSKLVREETAQTAPLYRVVGQDGKDLACKTEQSSGVLTITVDADVASLTGYLGGLQALQAQDIDTIVFVTKGATSTFALADLLATMTAGDSYTLTHDGSTVTFTLSNGTDISSIVK